MNMIDGTPEDPAPNAVATEALQLENLMELDAPIGEAAKVEHSQLLSGAEPNLFDGKVHAIVGRPRSRPGARPRRIYPSSSDRTGVTLREGRAAPQETWETWELGTVRAWARRNDWVTWEPHAGGFDITPGVVGKEYRVNRALLSKLNAVALKGGVTAEILSGYRSYASQLRLWLMWLAGRGNLAARPGTSNHELRNGSRTATAADVYIRGVAFWNYVNARPALGAYARRIGLTQPISREPWHVERQ